MDLDFEVHEDAEEILYKCSIIQAVRERTIYIWNTYFYNIIKVITFRKTLMMNVQLFRLTYID